jgi:retron-type reverse transcriptase
LAVVSSHARMAARSRILELLRAFDRWGSVFAAVDPYREDFREQLGDQLDRTFAGVWTELSNEFRGVPARRLLENAWAVALVNELFLATLHRIALASRSEEVVSRSSALIAASGEIFRGDGPFGAIARWDNVNHLTPPELNGHLNVQTGLQLRYGLARARALGVGSQEMLMRAVTQANASDYLRAREISRLVKAVEARGQRVEPIEAISFLLLPARAHRLALASHVVRTVFCIPSFARHPRLGEILERSRTHQFAINSSLEEIKRCLTRGDLSGVNRAIVRVPRNVVARRLIESALADFQGARLTGGARGLTRGKWEPLTSASGEWLKQWAGKVSVPAWWSMTADSIADGLCRREINLREVGPFLPQLRKVWSFEQQERFAKAGLGTLIPATSAAWASISLGDALRASVSHRAREAIVRLSLLSLADARPALSLLHGNGARRTLGLFKRALGVGTADSDRLEWEAFVCTAVGTPEWKGALPLASAGVDLLRCAAKTLKEGAAVVSSGGFVAEVESALRALLSRRQATTDAALYVAKSPSRWRALGEQLSERQIIALLRSPSLDDETFDAFARQLPESKSAAVARALIYRASSAEALIRASLSAARLRGRIEWRDEWWSVKGAPEDVDVAWILAARRCPGALRLVAARSGAAKFQTALHKVCALLPVEARWDRGYLELLAVLGPSWVAMLAVVMAKIDRSATPGNKLNGAYQQYALPKRSGGNRLISVPHPVLKRVQRAILEKVFAQLESHPAAFGYVCGRSVRDNAAVHVGQPIVANADVRNCFPSVKWSLVLGALRRDLGVRFSPGAISLLVDICTSNGGLPIGAPTSPALLNRVLLRTDEVLAARAIAWNCRYSRYADDLTFSGDHAAVRMLGVAARTLGQIGLELDPKKTNIFRRGRRQIVTGLVVNDGVSVPRRIRRRMRAAIKRVESGEHPLWHGKPESVDALRGRIAFVEAVNPKHGEQLKARYAAATGRDRS